MHQDSLEILSQVSKALSSELNLEKLAQTAMDAGHLVTNAQLGAFLYHRKDAKGESCTFYTSFGAPREAFANFPTAIFAAAYKEGGIVRLADLTTDPRYGKNTPYCRILNGPLPVRSYMAAPVLSRSGEVLGGLFFGHSEPGIFTERTEQALAAIVGQASVAIDNAHLFRAVQSALAAHSRVEEEVRAGEEISARLAAIVDHSDDAIISKDLNGTIKTWNNGAERLFGYTAKEAIGKSVTLLIPPERANEEPDILRRLRQGERVDHYETVRRRKDGTLLDISLTVSPIKDGRGQIIGASKIARDITERKRAEAALRRSESLFRELADSMEKTVAERTASLREAIAQMEEFSYTVSHDLRAPLRAMQGYSQTLLQDFAPLLPDEAKRAVTRIAENAAHLDKMILDVLSYSKLARSDIRLEKISLDRVARQVVEQCPGMQLPAAEIQIDPLPDVLGHDPSLTQALANLLNNAVKFVEPQVTPKVHIWAENRNDRVRLWIEDNGIGINPAYQHKVFNLFERVHPHLKYEGTGIGLAIVRKAVERMGGAVGMESDGVHGSRFWMELRAAS